jgi:transposase
MDATVEQSDGACDPWSIVGRKNHYGSKSRRGTEVASIFYSLIETAKLHNVDPTRYLREAVRAADRGEVLLPWQLES